MFDLSGKVAVVTGGSRGIGYMIAQGFQNAGANVVITSRSEQACQEARTKTWRRTYVDCRSAQVAQICDCL